MDALCLADIQHKKIRLQILASQKSYNTVSNRRALVPTLSGDINSPASNSLCQPQTPQAVWRASVENTRKETLHPFLERPHFHTGLYFVWCLGPYIQYLIAESCSAGLVSWVLSAIMSNCPWYCTYIHSMCLLWGTNLKFKSNPSE